MFKALATFVSTYPRWILGAWLLLFVAAVPLANRVGEVLTAQAVSAEGSVAERVSTVLGEAFESEGETIVLLVAESDSARLGTPAFDDPFDEALRRVRALESVIAVQDYRTAQGIELSAPDNSFTVALVSLDTSFKTRDTSREIRALLADIEGLDFNLAGGPATQAEVEAVSQRDALRAELFGLPLSLIVLVTAFGAVLASGLPIITALASITLSFAALFLIGQRLEFAVFTQSIVTMLGLATGIDYALLMVNRFREELRRDPETPRHAAFVTTQTAGKAVAFSGVTVMVALGALLVPPLPFIRSIGVGTMVVMGTSVTVSLTALPALLALLGKRVNWLRVTRREPGLRSRAYWASRARQVLRRPWSIALGGTLVLALLSFPALRIQLADPGPRALSASTEAGQAFRALQEAELEGFFNAFDILVDFGERGFFHPSSVRAVSELTRAVDEVEGVAGVYSALTAEGVPRLLLFQYYASQASALDSELEPLVRATVSREGRYALVRAFPFGTVTPNEGRDLLRAIKTAAAALDLTVQVGGAFVDEAEWTEALYQSFPLAVGLVYLVTFVLLGIAFRSVLIPIKSIILNTLTVSAAFGVITLIFQFGVGQRLLGLDEAIGFVDSNVPIFIFAIVFGLSMDYEVFLMERFCEAHRRGLDDRAAIVEALSATGGVITSAATIMIIVFSVFIFSEVVLIKTLGIGLAVAIFVDATLVRVALVPAVVTLAGRWNWWLPKPVARFVKQVDLGHD